MGTLEKLDALERYCNNRLAAGGCDGCVIVFNDEDGSLSCGLATSCVTTEQIDAWYDMAFAYFAADGLMVKFPEGVVVNIDDVPEDFESQIIGAFKTFARCAHPKYLNQCKLSFIEYCVGTLRNAEYGEKTVTDMILSKVKQELTERGVFPGKDEVFNLDFMVDCFERGRKDALLYGAYTTDQEANEKIMELLYRAIKAVINFELIGS